MRVRIPTQARTFILNRITADFITGQAFVCFSPLRTEIMTSDHVISDDLMGQGSCPTEGGNKRCLDRFGQLKMTWTNGFSSVLKRKKLINPGCDTSGSSSHVQKCATSRSAVFESSGRLFPAPPVTTSFLIYTSNCHVVVLFPLYYFF